MADGGHHTTTCGARIRWPQGPGMTQAAFDHLVTRTRTLGSRLDHTLPEVVAIFRAAATVPPWPSAEHCLELAAFFTWFDGVGPQKLSQKLAADARKSRRARRAIGDLIPVIDDEISESNDWLADWATAGPPPSASLDREEQRLGLIRDAREWIVHLPELLELEKHETPRLWNWLASLFARLACDTFELAEHPTRSLEPDSPIVRVVCAGLERTIGRRFEATNVSKWLKRQRKARDARKPDLTGKENSVWS